MDVTVASVQLQFQSMEKPEKHICVLNNEKIKRQADLIKHTFVYISLPRDRTPVRQSKQVPFSVIIIFTNLLNNRKIPLPLWSELNMSLFMSHILPL